MFHVFSHYFKLWLWKPRQIYKRKFKSKQSFHKFWFAVALLSSCFILLIWMKDHVGLYVFCRICLTPNYESCLKSILPPEMRLSKYDLDIKVLWCCMPVLYLDVIWSRICACALSKAKPWIIMVPASATYLMTCQNMNPCLVVAVQANHFCFLIFLKQVAPCHSQRFAFIPEAVRCWQFGTELR
jgi:hypothetical protein